jgi:hypothetical protein
MIELKSEKVMSLSEAAKHVPSRRAGKRCAVQTLYRWAQTGHRGVKLETLRVGGTLCTSLEALQRFCERLSSGQVPAQRSGEAADVVDQRLAAEGFDGPLSQQSEARTG